MMRHLLPFSLLFVSAAPVEAGRLCRDLKGLYTPCPREEARRGHAPARPRVAEAASIRPAAAPKSPAGSVRAAAERPSRSPLVAEAKHCHDLKGLYTPCPR